ncbi:MAG: hypothetical protein IPN90_06935 [Elusimicrobia bacterium]|nr:hypothetical protein [Elusimicrobiota bacterium]
MMKPRRGFTFFRGGAVCCAALTLLTNVVGVYASENVFWGERRRSVQNIKHHRPKGERDVTLLAQLPGLMEGAPKDSSTQLSAGLSPALLNEKIDPRLGQMVQTLLPYGDLRFVRPSANRRAPLVIHFQDLHGNLDAQRNMADMILALGKDHGVRLVGLEGATGAFSIDEFKRYPDQSIVKRVAAHFMKKDLIGGPEYAGLVSPHPITVWGIEDPALYQANVAAVKQSLRSRDRGETVLFALRETLTDLKSKFYSKELQAYDVNKTLYEQNQQELDHYLASLIQFAGIKTERVAGQYPNVARLLSALRQEKALHFPTVERERATVIRVLGDTLSPADLQDLLRQSVDLRAGKRSHSSYQTYFQDLCRRYAISLERYPSLIAYMNYLAACEAVERETLLSEMDNLEIVSQDALVQTSGQKDLVALSRDASLVTKLLSNEMTPTQWATYSDRRPEILNMTSRLRKLGGPLSPALPESDQWAALTAPFEDFCGRAVDRNSALSHRLLTKMNDEHQSVAVLVAGGFHTDGLTDTMTREGATVAVFTPKVGAIDTSHRYIDAFAQDPLPLEKIFSGEPISLRTACALATDQENQSVITALRIAIIGLTVNAKKKALESSGKWGDSLKGSLEVFMETFGLGPDLGLVGVGEHTIEIKYKGVTAETQKNDSITLSVRNQDAKNSPTNGTNSTSSAKDTYYLFLKSMVIAFQNGNLDSIKEHPMAKNIAWQKAIADMERVAGEVSYHLISRHETYDVETPYEDDYFQHIGFKGLPGIVGLLPKFNPKTERLNYLGYFKFNHIKGSLGGLLVPTTRIMFPRKTTREGKTTESTFIFIQKMFPKPTGENIGNVIEVETKMAGRGFLSIDSNIDFYGVSPEGSVYRADISHFQINEIGKTKKAGARVPDVFSNKVMQAQLKMLIKNYPERKINHFRSENLFAWFLMFAGFSLFFTLGPTIGFGDHLPSVLSEGTNMFVNGLLFFGAAGIMTRRQRITQGNYPLPEDIAADGVPRVLSFDHKKSTNLELKNVFLAGESRSARFNLRREYQLNDTPSRLKDIRAYRAYLLKKIRAKWGDMPQDSHLVSAIDTTSMNNIGDSIRMAHDNEDFRKALQWWALAEAWLASAGFAEKFNWRYWNLLYLEWRTFSHRKGVSGQDRLLRVATYSALLRASNRAMVEFNGYLDRQIVWGMDINILFGAVGSNSRVRPHPLLTMVAERYNSIMTLAASITIWLKIAISSLADHGENLKRRKVIFFDMDLLRPDSKASDEDKNKIIVALSGLLSLPEEDLKKVVLITTREIVQFHEKGTHSTKHLDVFFAEFLSEHYPRYSGVLNRIRDRKVVSPATSDPTIFKSDNSIDLDPLLVSGQFTEGVPDLVDFWTFDEKRTVVSQTAEVTVVRLKKLTDLISEFLKQQFLIITSA